MPTILAISDADDPRLHPYRDIRERDLVQREGLFIAEGRVVLAMLIASPLYRPRSILIAEHRLASLEDLLAPLDDTVPVYTAPQAVLDGITGFAVHRGILAIGHRTEAPSARALLDRLPPGGGDVLLLSAIANHDNMGGIFRNAAAFGAQAIFLDADCCDPLYRKAIRVSVGDPVELFEDHDFAPLALSPAGATTLAAVPAGRRHAVMLGAEGPGLSAALLDRVSTIRIPMAPGFDSLNVATTSGIVLHQLQTLRG